MNTLQNDENILTTLNMDTTQKSAADRQYDTFSVYNRLMEQNLMDTQQRNHALLNPQNHAVDNYDVTSQKSARSITTNRSVVSRRKDGRKQINQYILIKKIGE